MQERPVETVAVTLEALHCPDCNVGSSCIRAKDGEARCGKCGNTWPVNIREVKVLGFCPTQGRGRCLKEVIEIANDPTHGQCPRHGAIDRSLILSEADLASKEKR